MNQLQKEPETLTISRTAAVLGFSRNKVRSLVKDGTLRVHRLGKRDYLLRDEIIEDLKK